MKNSYYVIALLSLMAFNFLAVAQSGTTTNNIQSYMTQPTTIKTRWAKYVGPNNALKEYPRPQMQRENWKNLNGLWDYAITDSTTKFPRNYDGKILVPYPIESALSGVQKRLMPYQRIWYKRNISNSLISKNHRLILNFGAVDWEATVYINGEKIANHTGGYQNFSIDITNYLTKKDNDLIIQVYDPTNQGPNPHGKQVLNPDNIYYTASSGIWQTVWVEKVPTTFINHIKTTPNIDNSSLSLEIDIDGEKSDWYLEVLASIKGATISRKKMPVVAGNSNTIINLDIPNQKLWTPDTPFLYDLNIKLIKGNKTIDEVTSYFGMRKINIQQDEKGADRIFLNNKYTYNLGVLDQGFWPEGLYTAPTDEALAFDIKAIKSMGFNTIRKHIKIEPERWYYYADKIGILVWQDFVNPPQNLTEEAKSIFEEEIKNTIEQLHNHPSIITWVLFNERWGEYDQQRLTEWIKKSDPSRIVNGHSGELLYVNNLLREPAISPWIRSDMSDIHSYPDPKNPPGLPGKAKVIGEFGGIGVSVPNHQWNDIQGWGYIQVSPSEFKARYQSMNQLLKLFENEGLSASIYTQPFDVEGEENGLLTYDREVIKIPINEIRRINKTLISQNDMANLDSNFFIARNIDINDTDDRYIDMLNRYDSGVQDSIFLRRLILMAIRKKDQPRATQIANSYLGSLTDLYSRANLLFINNITRTTEDIGFRIFRNQSKKIDSILGNGYAELKVKTIINKEKITPYLKNNTRPNWDSIQQDVSTRYGYFGEELVLGKRMIYYAQIKQDWNNFGKYYMLYFKKALTRPEYKINELSWLVFEHVNDPEVLEYAVNVMEYDLKTWDDKSAAAYDTYANLLHKLNKTSEAIPWEEKAVKLKKGAPDEKLYTDALQKMKSGLPTWPQNN